MEVDGELQKRLIDAAREGDMEMLSDTLDTKGCVVDWQNEEGNTALHEATKAGKRVAVMKLLDDYNANPLLKNKKGQTPMHLACYHGRIAQYLAKYSPDCDDRDNEGNTPMILIAKGNAEKAATIAGTLINRGCKFDHVNNEGRTALHYTALRDNIDFSRILVQTGLNPKQPDNSGQMPIDLCTDEKHLAVLLEVL